ncbi:ribosome biogenesis gtpase [Lichtheimia corymbifera JMRC:FSU:9682]|uniref:Ribosome biogenesis gtpase n=1 Tax=Lichtheimia corymbifera JMRC:FSU:9682 TaxID=1263082 RepID=A0A068S4L3_9FUNG|nr:ribosome biogenesis gtpase [Lichtheimia corymbifera JMRC:FSU:9682]
MKGTRALIPCRRLISSRSRQTLVPRSVTHFSTLAMRRPTPHWSTTAIRSTWATPVTVKRLTSTAATLHCPGCGAPFQSSDSSKPGFYVEREKKPAKEKKRSNKTLDEQQYQAAVENLDPETRALLLQQEEPSADENDTLHDEVIEKVDDIDEKKTTRRIICERCYQLEHRGNSNTSAQFLRASKQYSSLEFLKTKRNPLIVVVVDVTDLPFSLAQLPTNPTARFIVAANKFDLLPGSARRHEQRLRDWIVQHAKQQGISTSQIQHVQLVSATKGWGIQGLLRRIDEERMPTDDVYLVGATNVGKSALVNQIVSQQRTGSDKRQYRITSSPAPGTTMGTIRIPMHALGMSSNNINTPHGFQRDRFLVDTPGIINDQQLIHLMPFSDQKKFLRQHELKPLTFRLLPGKSLVLKPFIRIDLVESTDPVLLTLFTHLNPHITKTAKLDEKMQAATDSSSLSLLDPKLLQLDTLQPIPELLKVQGFHKSRASLDLAFASMGWAAVTGLFNEAKFRIWLPSQVDPYKAFSVREPPMLPFEYRGVLRKFYGSGERARK